MKKPIYIKFLFLIFLLGFIACQPDNSLFKRILPEDSGINFMNSIDESDSFNILNYEYIYNGAGVAAADFNNNGYPDLFFVGNMTQNRLYLNQGDYQFSDVTQTAGIGGNDKKWYSGVSVIDINNDGLPDIYICATGRDDPELRRNELYVNQGVNSDGIPVFIEMAAEYGLDDTSYSTQAHFFDYNNDGTLDMYLLVAHSASSSSYSNVRFQAQNQHQANKDKLYNNTWNPETEHAMFVDVSEEAGINKSGYGLGATVIDINNNGLKDIYVANDYISDDLFWINNGDGTFTDRLTEIFNHTSFSAMGTDAADINNSGRLDIFTLDMLPELNYRRKMMANPNNYRNYINNAFEGYHNQYTRNTLQLNLGAAHSSGLPLFSEISLLAGVAATDWSWAPLLADLNNNGLKDIFITNGIPRDVTDKDFWDEYGRVRGIMPMDLALSKIPEVKIPNYIFQNIKSQASEGGVMFNDVTEEWGFEEPTYSTGAVYVDLDNNGFLDLVVNNINQPAFLYKNMHKNSNWLKINFKGDEHNRMGLGAKIDIYFGEGVHQTYEHTIYRGYLSSVEPVAHFGVGQASIIDSVIVTWPDRDEGMLQQQLIHVQANQTVTVDITDAIIRNSIQENTESIFKDVTQQKGVSFYHSIPDFNDFRDQPLLPYKLSRHGTGIAAGDISGNGLVDIFIGGASGTNAVILYQQENGSFKEVVFEPRGETQTMDYEDASVSLFDANGNGLPDLYIASGGVEHEPGHPNYRDRFYRNDGGGVFTYLPDAIPTINVSGSVAVSADYNKDGKPDLFIGGRAIPGRYPEPVSSFLLRNDSSPDEIRFTDVTNSAAPVLTDFGIVNDAVWADFNNNGSLDLVIAAEWKPITFLENRDGIFVDVTESKGVSDEIGWWFSIIATDINNDGYTDFVAGNLGLNSLYKATDEEPVSIYFGDLAGDGFFESIPTIYLKDADGARKEFPAHNREDMFRQMPAIGNRLQNHKTYGNTTFINIMNDEELKKAAVYRANHLKSSVFLNNGDGTFDVKPLPLSAQSSPIFAIAADDFTGDGHQDLIIGGNLYGGDPQTGNYNAMQGLLLKGNSGGGFKTLLPGNSGIKTGEGRELIIIATPEGKNKLISFENNEFLKIYKYAHKDYLSDHN